MGKRHKPLFEEELQEEIRIGERTEQARMSASANRGGSKKGGFFRTAKIAAKVILEEVADLFKRTLAKRSARTVVVAAAVCVVGLAAIITVAAAASSRKDDDVAADANLAPEVGQIEVADSANDPANEAETAGADGNQTDDGSNNILAALGKDDDTTDESEPEDENEFRADVAEDTEPDGDDEESTEGSTAEDETETDTSDEAEETEKGANTVTVSFWGKESATYETDATTVGEFLTESGIELTDAQRGNIDTSLPIGGDITISADVVTYDKETVDEVIEFKTEYRESAEYPAGTTKTTQYGKDGSQTREYTVTYVNGAEVSREQTASWINSSPVTQIIVTGTGSAADDNPEADPPVSSPAPSGGGTFVGADGIERAYTHYIDVRATCYYVGGTTATGLPADENVIAVDPSVIPLGSTVYVTGDYGDFGVRIAADTGGSIKGYKIDVCIDPNDPRAGTFGWRDMRVYFLA